MTSLEKLTVLADGKETRSLGEACAAPRTVGSSSEVPTREKSFALLHASLDHAGREPQTPSNALIPLGVSVSGTDTVPPGELRVECAWCDEVMREGSGAAGALTSHSICDACYAVVVAA